MNTAVNKMEVHVYPVYCINCSTYHTFQLVYEEAIWRTAEHIPLKYYEVEAHCDHCGREVYVPFVNDLNVEHKERLYEKFGGKADGID